MLAIAEKLIKRHEGLRLDLYQCGTNHWTIGYGRNLQDRGISADEAEYLLMNDLKAVEDDLKAFPWYAGLSQVRQAVLADLRFCVGSAGFRGFRKMIAALEIGNYDEAALQILVSKFAEQTGKRADELAELMVMG